MITAQVVADSVSPAGVRLTTLELRFPRFLLAEFNTHRVFSRSASSSRAVPVKRLLAEVLEDPALPVAWHRNQPGMRGDVELTEEERSAALASWLRARNDAVRHARALDQGGVHKQLVNRLLEPWSHARVVVTATDWANFFALRCHPDAQPELQVLARTIQHVRAASEPTPLPHGAWHLPYVDAAELRLLPAALAIARGGQAVLTQGVVDAVPNDDIYALAVKLSTARCARVSYLTHEGERPSVAADLALYDKLVGATPLHASPAEHQATPDEEVGWVGRARYGRWLRWRRPHLHGNLRGWVQHRKTLVGEAVAEDEPGESP